MQFTPNALLKAGLDSSVSFSKPLTLSRLVGAGLMLLLLSGCVTTPPIEPAPDEDGIGETLWIANKARLESIHSWKIKGKMAVKTGKKGGSATLKWAYTADNQDIELYGPFGGGRVQIEANANGATLRDTKGRVLTGQSADDVLYQRLGWQVPFDQMVYWGRGIPSLGAHDIVIDAQGRLKSLQQGTWQVDYEDYRIITSVQQGKSLPLELPRKLTISALPGTMEIYDDDGNYIGDELSVKIILKRWWDIQSDAPLL